ncbi:MAG TPA: VOC family protein, partial [Candidatus Saccharimonadia bacterium]|nr:VOC family protein [Candidatus Saccharimonadia bacterium]
VDKVRTFYKDTLGLEVEEDSKMGMFRLKLMGGGEVMIYPKGPAHQAATFTVLNFITEDLEDTVEKLAAKGVKFEQYDMPEIKTNAKGIAKGGDYGPDMAWMADPAGNIIAVMQIPKR